ncbi:hypothetical protein KKB10_03485 [Patescibacteria group bacterium]|nr:hypothetical protein [Patescibacteria group bacterium]MBU1951349.1 hypothetical protein [Patescibacteria group bacterium]
MKEALKKFNKTATISVCIALLCLIAGFGVNIVIAATWQDPAVAPPHLGSLEPVLNTSLYAQEKIGGLNIATQDGSLGVGTTVVGTNKLYVGGTTFLEGNADINGDLSVSASTNVLDLLTDSATVANDLNVHGGLLNVDSATNSIFINSINNSGLLNVEAEDGSGIVAINNSNSNAAIQGVNDSVVGGTGIYGYGLEYGISSRSSTGYGILADAKDTGIGGVFARGRDTGYGLIARGSYGVVGFDNTENIDNPVFSGPGTTLAGLFEGSVDIIPSAGGNADLGVNANTLFVSSFTDKVGVGTGNPATKLHIWGASDLSATYAKAGVNTAVAEYDGPTATVAGIYGEGGTVTYSGSGTGWDFGVFGKAGNPGVGRSVGVMGVEDGGGSDQTFAGWFDGDLIIGDSLETGEYTSAGELEIAGDMIGNGDLSLTGNIVGQEDIAYFGKLKMTGGLPFIHGRLFTCDLAPTNYAEGTMYVCAWCPSLEASRFFALKVRMNRTWVTLGYTKGGRCSGSYDPEVPVDSLP